MRVPRRCAGRWTGTPAQSRPPVRHRDPALHVLPREDDGGALRVEAERMEERAGVLGQQVAQARRER